MSSVFTELAIDCSDPRRVAAFWAEVLGYRVTEEDEGGIEIGGPEEGSPTLTFVPVPEPKTVKNRIHIDLSPLDRDQDEEVERILGLGATRADVGQGRQTWVVLADPEGNEFCVLRTRLKSNTSSRERASQEASMESFPASDPPAW